MTSTTEKESLRRDRKELESALVSAGAVIRGNVVRCPFHDDRHPSGSIHLREDGAWAFKCHGCGINEDVIGIMARTAGKGSDDVLREMRKETQPRPPRVFPTLAALLESIGHWLPVEANYVYANPDTGAAEMVVVRCRDEKGAKVFRQASPCPDGFVQRAPPKPWPLYNRRRVKASPEVVVVEGEKCVHALHDVGIVATTSPGGADNAHNADWNPIAGKTVFLWPDNDLKGIQYMRDVAEAARKLSPAPRLVWVEPSALKLPESSDVVDYLAAYGGETHALKAESVRCALEQAVPYGPSASVRKLIEDTISGTRSAVPWPWRMLGAATNALLPGSVTIVCGDPAANKSFFLLQAARHWHERGIKFALYQLEEDEDGSHLLRALVQQSVCTDLLNPNWVKCNPDTAREIYERYGAFLDSFGANLTTPPREPPPLKDLADWVRDRAKDGCRVIAIDPITAAESSDKPWIADKKFILNTKIIVRDFGASLILVTHPRRNGKGTLDDVAGGMGYVQFAQTVLFARKHKPMKPVRVRLGTGDLLVSINRSLRIGKSRLGPGDGAEIGYVVGDGLLFAEQGMIVKEAKGDE